jgi:REP element-mobilizing transposase RayT
LHYSSVIVDRFVIMPNHIHMVIIVGDGLARPARVARSANPDPSQTTGRASPSPTLGNIVGGFKSSVSRLCGFPIWQRSYHDHIIRNEQDYVRIAEYIDNNPANWKQDCFYGGEKMENE